MSDLTEKDREIYKAELFQLRLRGAVLQENMIANTTRRSAIVEEIARLKLEQEQNNAERKRIQDSQDDVARRRQICNAAIGNPVKGEAAAEKPKPVTPRVVHEAVAPVKKAVPRVADHAVIRYLERVHDFCFEDVRKELLTRTVIMAMDLGARRVKRDDGQLVIDNHTVVTFLPKEQSRYRSRS